MQDLVSKKRIIITRQHPLDSRTYQIILDGFKKIVYVYDSDSVNRHKIVMRKEKKIINL